MSLTETRLVNVVRKQLVYKIKAYSGMFRALIIIQVIALLFSFSGMGMSGTQIGGLDVSVQYYSADIVIVFTMMWGFVHAIQLKTHENVLLHEAFVSNPLSHNLSNILFLGVASVFGGITALLSSYLLRDVFYFLPSNPLLHAGLPNHLSEWLMGAVTTIMDILLVVSLGYLIGTLIRMRKFYVFVLLIVAVGLIFILAYSMEIYVPLVVGKFYFTDASFLRVMVKIIATVVILFAGSTLLSNRLEAR